MKIKYYINLSLILLGVLFFKVGYASNSCLTINQISNYGDYGIVNWTLNNKNNCNSGNVYSFAFSTTTPYQWYNTSGSLSLGSLSLHKDTTGNLNYPDTVWSKEAGGACNSGLTNISAYNDGSTYTTYLYYLVASSTNKTWSGGFSGDHIYLNIYSTNDHCNFQNNEEKYPAVIDTEAYTVYSNIITALSPLNETYTNPIDGIKIEFSVETGSAYDEVWIQTKQPDGQIDYFKKKVYSTATSTIDYFYISPRQKGVYYYTLFLTDFLGVKLNDSGQQTFTVDGVPSFTPFTASTSKMYIDFPAGASTTASSFGFTYRACESAVANMFDMRNWSNCAYNLMASTTEFFFIPQSASLAFLTSAVNQLTDTFPFNILFHFEETAEMILQESQSSETLTIPQLGSFTPSLTLISASTLNNFFGSDVTSTYFNFMDNVIWFSAGLIMLYSIL